MRIVVTGANRGIGLELARQLAARGDVVEATARNPGGATELQVLAQSSGGRLRVHALDVASDQSMAAFADAIEGPVDAVVNNAGVYGRSNSLQEWSTEDLLASYSTNALGPLRVTVALLPHLAQARLQRQAIPKVLHISTGMAVLNEPNSGGAYGYRMSKAALNMLARTLAADLRGRDIVVAVINPGWVQTDMGGAGAPTSVSDSARGILGWLDRMGPADSGQFLDWRGGKRSF